MFTIRQSVTIAKPVDQVFAFLANSGNIPRWRPDVVEVRSGDVPLKVGSEFSEIINFGGRKLRHFASTCMNRGTRLRWRRSLASASGRHSATYRRTALGRRASPFT